MSVQEFIGDRAAVYSHDCVDVLVEFPDSCVDCLVTDPPYGLSEHRPSDVRDCLRAWLDDRPYEPRARGGYMGKPWDAWVPGPEVWRELLRVLKPGAHAFIFAGTRSMDLMSMAIRLAGFEFRDAIGSAGSPVGAWVHGQGMPKSPDVGRELEKRGAPPDVVSAWEGWGNQLKPAWEPILMVRKPVDRTILNNVVAHDTGALHIDACRVGKGTGERRIVEYPDFRGGNIGQDRALYASRPPIVREVVDQGRWPANVVHDGSPEVSRQLGKATEYYYAAKPTSAERAGSRHPTVKPLSLMRWLVRLGCPPNGCVLDPFCGSGTTVEAALLEGFHAVGIERDPAFYSDILARVHRATAADRELAA